MKKQADSKRKKKARPVVRIRDLKRISRLQPTHREIAAFFDIRLHVWQRLLATNETVRDAYERGKQEGLTSLRRTQFRLAKNNSSMAIRLGEVWLGQKSTSRTEVTGADGVPLQYDLSQLSAEKRNELRELIISTARS